MRGIARERITAWRVRGEIVARRWSKAPAAGRWSCRGRSLRRASRTTGGLGQPAQILPPACRYYSCCRRRFRQTIHQIGRRKALPAEEAWVKVLRRCADPRDDTAPASIRAVAGTLYPVRSIGVSSGGCTPGKATFMQHCDEMWRSDVFGALLRGLQLLSFAM